MPYCASCGNSTQQGQMFCPNCGTLVEGGKAPEHVKPSNKKKAVAKQDCWMVFYWRDGMFMINKYLLIRVEHDTAVPMIGIYHSDRNGNPQRVIAQFSQCDMQGYEKISIRRWGFLSVLALGFGVLGVVGSLTMGAGLLAAGVCAVIAMIGLGMSKDTAMQISLKNGQKVKFQVAENLFDDPDAIAFLKEITSKK